MKKDYFHSLYAWYATDYFKIPEHALNELIARFKINLNRSVSALITFLFIIACNFNSHAQLGTIQIGSGTATTIGSSAIPVTNYDYSYSQQIVTAAEFTGAGGAVGNITKMRYRFTSIGTLANWNDWTVYIGNTTKTAFTSNTDWVPLTDLTQVFSGIITPIANNWYEITFTAPFNYTGDNLIVAVDENTMGWLGSPEILSYTSSTNSGILYRADASNPDPASPPNATYLVSLLPQLQFEATLASCPPPANLGISNLSGISADLTWTEIGTATEWDVEYGVAGFSPTGIPTISNATNPSPIVGLTPNTNYHYYVRSICSPTDLSAWAGPFNFYTGHCQVSVLYSGDYTSNFSTSTAVNNVTYTATSNPSGAYTNQTAQTFTSFPTQEIEFAHSYVGGNNSYKIWIDWNGDLDFDDVGEEMSSYLGVSSPHNGSFTVPVGTPPGTYTVRFRSAYDFSGSLTVTPCGQLNYGTTIDFLLNVAPAPTCMPPSALTTSGLTSNSVDLGWQENGTATDWDIEYGLFGFTPTGVPSLSTTTNPTLLTGLASNTEFSFYVRAVCSLTDSSLWSGPYHFLTLCDALSAVAFCEDFELTSTSINCWRSMDANNDGVAWALYTGYPNSGTISAGIYTDYNGGNNDDYLISPNMILTGNEVMKFSYRVMSAGEPNDFQVLLSTTGTAAADFQDTILSVGQYANIVYKDTAINLSAYTGNVYIAFHIPPGGLDGWYLFIDDVCFDICTPNPGIVGSQTVCSLTPTLDLNTVITPGETNGVWEYNTNPNALNGSDLTLAALPYGTFEFDYIVTTACVSDTTKATITVVSPSSAGQDGSIAVCRNQPLNLLSGLTGNADLGGVWTDPNALVVPNGNTISSNIPGQYNFRYIVSNGVCPADTAKVVVNVQGCDYLVAVEEMVFEGFSIYPNPTSDMIYLANSGSTEVFNYELLDMNGRVILKEDHAIHGLTTTEVDLTKVEIGIYLMRVFNNQAEKTFRVVKN